MKQGTQRVTKPSVRRKVDPPNPGRRISYEREAEELRHGIETLISEKGELVRELVAFDADELAVKASDLLDLLDRVDARDSLAFLEKKDRRARSKTKARR